MDTFKSDNIAIAFPVETVYAKLANPMSLKSIELSADIPEDVKSKVDGVTFGDDTISFNVNPVGNVTLKVTNLVEPSLIEYTAVTLPIPVKAVIKLEKDWENCTVAVAELQVELNMFMRPMLERPLTDAAKRFGQLIGALPYGMM